MGRCHKPMAGTVWLRPMTLAAAVMDIVRSLAASGIHQVAHRQRPRRQLHAGGGRARAEPRASRADRAAAAHEPALERAADLRDGGHGGACRRVGDVRDDGHRRLAGGRRPRRLHPARRPRVPRLRVRRRHQPGRASGASRAWPRARRGNGPSTRACTRWCEYVRETLDRVARLKGRAGAPSTAGSRAAAATGPAAGSTGARGPSATGLNARSTTFEVERARPHTALLPLAAVEAHGPHLPVGCDTLVVESIARRPRRCSGPGRISCRPSRSAARRTCAALRAPRICRPTRCAWSCRTWRWRSTRRAFTGSR